MVCKWSGEGSTGRGLEGGEGGGSLIKAEMETVWDGK